MNSSIYIGNVRHRRISPAKHVFSYSLFMMYIDLAEINDIFCNRWLWSIEGINVASFRRKDHFGDPNLPLDQCVRDLVAQKTGKRPDGPIRLLTHLRYFGYCMNPVSFYYCFDRDGQTLQTVVAEVHNTPWGETHCYVCDNAVPTDQDGLSRHRFIKSFHVSPFMGMNQEYNWRLSKPDDRLLVHMENFEQSKKIFSATMSLARKPITGWNLAKALLRFPAMTLQVVIGIYWQALRLWLKNVAFHSHPKHQEKVESR